MSKTLNLEEHDFVAFEEQMKYYVKYFNLSQKPIDLSVFSDELLAYRACKDENGIWHIHCKRSGPIQVKLSSQGNALKSEPVVLKSSFEEEEEKELVDDNLANEVRGWRFWNEVNDKEKFEPFLIEFIRLAKKTDPTICSEKKSKYSFVYDQWLTEFRQVRTKADLILRMDRIPSCVHDEITDWLNELMGHTFSVVCKKRQSLNFHNQ